MTEKLYTTEPVQAIQRITELELAMETILKDPKNFIQDGHRIAAEFALYGIEEALARRMKKS